MRRSIALLVAMLCCHLSFCHRLVTSGGKKAWDWEAYYFAQSFAQDWKCEVATDVCVPETRPPLTHGTPLRAGTVGIMVFAIGSSLACLLLAVGSRRRIRMAIGILGIAWMGLLQNIEKGTPTPPTWIIVVCPAAIACVHLVRRRRSPIAQALLRS